MKFIKTTAQWALAMAVLAAPAIGSAQPNGYYDRYHHYHHYRTDGRSCEAVKRSHGNNGTAIGAVTGGVLGSTMGHGRFTNVLLGAGAGAIAGHAIGRSTVKC